MQDNSLRSPACTEFCRTFTISLASPGLAASANRPHTASHTTSLGTLGFRDCGTVGFWDSRHRSSLWLVCASSHRSSSRAWIGGAKPIPAPDARFSTVAHSRPLLSRLALLSMTRRRLENPFATRFANASVGRFVSSRERMATRKLVRHVRPEDVLRSRRIDAMQAARFIKKASKNQEILA